MSLMKKGIDAFVVSANLTESASREMVDGIVVNRLRVIKAPDFQIPAFWVSLCWFLWRNRRRFDLIHCHGTFQHGIVSLMGRWLGKPTILKIAMGQSDIAFHKHGRAWGRINRFLVSRFDRYIATSAEVQQECLERGLDPSRICTIPNGVATERFRPLDSPGDKSEVRRKLGLRDVPTVCYVGVIDARKNLDAILRIWKSVRDRTRGGQLVLIGPRPREEGDTPSGFFRELQRYAADNGFGDSVVFTGQQNDIPDWLRSGDVFLFPSKREGMPNALLEAMASGLACVASRIGGSVDIIEHGVDGFTFDVADEEGMAKTIAGLLQDPGRVAGIGAAARLKALTKFSLDQIADRYCDLYAELTGRPALGA